MTLAMHIKAIDFMLSVKQFNYYSIINPYEFPTPPNMQPLCKISHSNACYDPIE